MKCNIHVLVRNIKTLQNTYSGLGYLRCLVRSIGVLPSLSFSVNRLTLLADISLQHNPLKKQYNKIECIMQFFMAGKRGGRTAV